MENQNKSCEPMDIDLSSHSADMDVSYNDSVIDKINVKQENEDTCEYPTPAETIALSSVKMKAESHVQKIHINVPTQTKKIYHILKLKIFSAIFIIFFSIVTYHILNIKCSNEINLENFKAVLSTKLYGQSAAINSIIAAFNVTDDSKILFFYGGTGVGKTFAASLIMENMGYSSNIYHYTIPSFVNTFSTDFMIGLSICKNAMLIVDDLKRNDMHIKGHINDVITKSRNLQGNITIILIYNCDTDQTAKDFRKKCDESFSTKLLESFNEIRALKTLIKFKTLTEEHLIKCIQNEVKHKKIGHLDINKILKNFNVSIDGCKGVHTKMRVLETAHSVKIYAYVATDNTQQCLSRESSHYFLSTYCDQALSELNYKLLESSNKSK